MKKTLASIVLVCGVALSSQAIAFRTFYNGNEILDACTSTKIGARQFCHAYIAGVSDTLEWRRAAKGLKTDCVRMSASTDQVADVAIKFLKEHPADRDSSAAALIQTALEESFCFADKL
jgi:hypothetical protein